MKCSVIHNNNKLDPQLLWQTRYQKDVLWCILLQQTNRTGGGNKAFFKGSSKTKAGKYGFPFQSSRATGITKGKVASPRVHQKRVVVLDHKENCPEVYALADAMVLIDGNIRYQGNDDELNERKRNPEGHYIK